MALIHYSWSNHLVLVESYEGFLFIENLSYYIIYKQTWASVFVLALKMMYTNSLL